MNPLKLFPLAITAIPAYCAALDFEGAATRPVEITTEASTGLDAVYVLRDGAGIRLSHTSASPASVRWYRFSRLGGAYAEELTPAVSATKSSVPLDGQDMGYIIEENGRRKCYWIIDYSAHRLELEAISARQGDDCHRTEIALSGNAAEIPYYTINGRRLTLSRELELSYSTLSFDDGSFSYVTSAETTTLPSLSSATSIDAPLCNTVFTLSGDRFLKAWGESESVASPEYTTTAVEATTRATQETRESDNEQKENSEAGLGGSAPCTILFEAATSDAAVFQEWQISRSVEFETIENSFNDLSFDYTFRESGTSYVRFTANNADGTCEYTGPVYEVFIGESRLEIPNAFSPEATPGVNDLWKVSYKSLVSFQCHIFNRWGTEIYTSTDPSQGWDGKYRGKFVPAGVYYYIIKAKGSDGVEYERAGDINIIKYKEGKTSTEPTE